MYMHWVDWAIVIGLMSVVTFVALTTRKYTRSVADFLAANRCAGRYILSIAGDIAGAGALSFIAQFELFYKAGFSAAWWGFIGIPLWMLISMSGWMTYRFRETRALTTPEFLETRYSKRFRVAYGLIGWLAGVVGIGIMPAVVARFFMHFCGLPPTFPLLGLHVSTFPVLMLILLAMALFYTSLGGQISVIVTDFVQGMFCNVAFLILLFALIWMFPWGQIRETLKNVPAGASLLNPLHTSEVKDFDIWFFIIQQFVAAYMFRTSFIGQGFNSAAKSPHEAKMAGVVGGWRGFIQSILVMMMPICAYVVMHSPAHAATAQQVREQLASIDNPQLQEQMTVPAVLAHILPVGLMGTLCAVMLAAAITSQGTCIHAFGSVLLQDIALPFRKSHVDPHRHVRLLRLSITAVAALMFVLCLYYKPVEYIYMFMAIAGALFSGAGAALIGGLYWKRGTTTGAWAGMTCGAAIAVGGYILTRYWTDTFHPAFAHYFPNSAYLAANAAKFPINGNWISVIAMFASIGGYVAFSLFDWLVRRLPAYPMDKMLHRGAYAIVGEHLADTDGDGALDVDDAGKPKRHINAFLRTLGLTEEFTRADKIIFWGIMAWTMGWFVIFAVMTILNLATDVSDDTWAAFWHVKIWITVVLGVATTVWFLIGGVIDVREMFRLLRRPGRDDADDGTALPPSPQRPTSVSAAAPVAAGAAESL